MSNQCPFCHSPLGDSEKFCTNCGAPNSFYREPGADEASAGETSYYAENTNTEDSFSFAAGKRPKTIEELKEWAQAKNLPLQDMRFFIGENYMSPRAFGIYEEDGEFIVYKNKADGSRAVRYKGKDEAHAVGELYDKMRDEIKKRKGSAGNRRSPGRPGTSYTPDSTGSRPKKSSGKSFSEILGGIIFFAIVAVIVWSVLSDDSPSSSADGYYYYDDSYYYHQGNYWFEYDDTLDRWNTTNPDNSFLDNYSDYYYGYNYSNSFGNANFSDSDYYQNEDYGYYAGNDDYDDDDDDYDYTWDNNDDWDAGGTDWDTDW